MRIIPFNFILILIFSSKFLSVKAQFGPNIGYYITSTNDTVKALFKDDPQKKLTYQVTCFDSTNQDWVKIYPGQIEKFYIQQGERFYESEQLDLATNKQTKVFLRCILDGYLSLYSVALGSNHEYYLKDTTDSLIKLEYSENKEDYYVKENKKYRGQLKYIMRDKPELYDDINKTDYKKEQLIQLFENYNKLAEKDYQLYYKNRIELLKNIQIGGFYMSNLRDFSCSFYGEVFNPDFSKHSSIRIDLNYCQVNKYSLEEYYYYYPYGEVYSFAEVHSLSYDTVRYNYDVSFKMLSLSYNYQYKYYNKIVVPYFYIGVSLSINDYKKEADNPKYSEHIKNKNRIQFISGIGLERNIAGNFYVYAELRTEIIERINIGLKYKF